MMMFTLNHIIERGAQEFPGKDAFRFLEQSISYKNLEEKAVKVACYLQSKGIKKGDRVGIYMNRCLESSFAIYGILKAGCVYVPLDPFAPIARTSFLIKDCGIACIISTPQQKRKLVKIIDNNQLIDSIIGIENSLVKNVISWTQIDKVDIKYFASPNTVAEDLAYILYTSGSTGTPKGIMHTHYSALSYAQLSADLYGLTSEDILGNHAPTHFDVSTFGYFSGPLVSATTVIASDAHTKLPASLATLIEKEKISVWYSVPLALIQMLQHKVLEGKNFSSLRLVLFAGEVFTTKYLRELMLVWTDKKFSNIYGPTETNQCTYYNLNTPPEGDAPIPIGKVWANTEYKILDDDDKEVKNGTQGELVISSATVMKGYWNNTELTKKSFFTTQLQGGFSKTYYRTGDQVILNENGDFIFFGRKDHQIKLRGYRIEIDEIEQVLLKHAAVTESAVILSKTGSKEFLIANVITTNKEEISEEIVMAFCEKYLPQYAIPEQIRILDSLPRTSSGKIDRKQIEKEIK